MGKHGISRTFAAQHSNQINSAKKEGLFIWQNKIDIAF